MEQPSEQIRLASAQVASMAANGVAGALSGLFGAGLTAAVLHALFGLSARDALWWIVPLAIAYATHLGLCRYWGRPRAKPQAGCRQFAAVGGVEGMLWGANIVLAARGGSLDRELFLVLMGAGVAGAIGLSFGPYLPAFFARFLPATVPYVVWASLWAQGDVALHRVLAVTVAAFILSNTQLARGFNANFLATHRARLREHDLAEALRVQKDLAEAATLAKSRFLAAASHDLRQPVHTLRFYVAALRGLPLDRENTTILTQIETGIGRIDTLFAGMLDLSRIDSGRLTPAISTFPLAPLLLAIGRDHAEDAHAKQLRLRIAPTALSVTTDRVLLDRMIRNLVGNAIRYTTEGGVLVGARRRGDRIDIEIYDTGPGVAPENRQAIFEEFQQIRARGAERTDGIGLGLTIVRRLADLLGITVFLRSTPGRGSCFGLSLPGPISS